MGDRRLPVIEIGPKAWAERILPLIDSRDPSLTPLLREVRATIVGKSLRIEFTRASPQSAFEKAIDGRSAVTNANNTARPSPSDRHSPAQAHTELTRLT